jgi:hypothetical protein
MQTGGEAETEPMRKLEIDDASLVAAAPEGAARVPHGAWAAAAARPTQAALLV